MTRPISAHPRTKSILKQAYHLLLRAYPQQIRLEYAEEMDEVFSDQVEEASQRGLGALCSLAGSEYTQTTAAVLRAYGSNRYLYLDAAFQSMIQGMQHLFQVDPPENPDGRTSWMQAILEMALFAFLGLVLIGSTYLPMLFRGSTFSPYATLAWVFPVLWLGIGLARGLPRWALPVAGLGLAIALFASLVSNAIIIFTLLFLAAMGLLVGAYKVHRWTGFLPEVILRWRENLSTDLMRLSFGVYGILPLAIIVAFDDAYVNNRTPCLLAAVVWMIAGAFTYSRSRKTVWQWMALEGGVTLSLFMAVIDHEVSTSLAWKNFTWIFFLWLNLSLLILVPVILKLFHLLRNFRNAPSSPGV